MAIDIEIPGYELIKEIGSGGMARVFAGTQLSLDRQVAIKVLRASHTGEDFRLRFLHEGKMLAKLIHPNIVPIYDIGQTDSAYYMAMEYLRGGTLTDRIREGLTVAEIIRICIRVAQALGLAHDHQIVHRDLKPSNIMFRDELTPVLTDFGIARKTDVDHEITRTGMSVGTPYYMSPEQLTGKPIDGRADIYSLGVMLYQLLVGEPPFRAEEPLALAMQHVQAEPPPLPEGLAALQPVIDRMLAKKPDDRFSTMLDFCFAIRELVLSEQAFAAKLRGETELFDPEQFSDPRFGTDWVARSVACVDENRTPTRISRPLKRPGPADERVGFGARVRRWFGRRPTPSQPTETAAETQMVSADALAELDARYSRTEAEDAAEATSMLPAEGTEAARLPVSLIVTVEDDPGWQGRRIDIDRFPFRVGRAEDAELRLTQDAKLSRRHLEISRAHHDFQVSVFSVNGINLSGRRIAQGRTEPLLFSDTLVLSDRVRMKFVAAMPTLPNLAGTVLNGRYQLDEQLHSSIKASTFAARDLRLPRNLAVKVLAPGLEGLSHYRAGFDRQAEIAASLNHPHIAKVLDRGETVVQIDDRQYRACYLCMAWMPGGNLETRLSGDSQPELEQIAGWLDKIGQALGYAHEANIVHGALKPSAIVFDDQDNPYLADFALSCAEGDTTGPTVMGAPAYLAPEQWEGGAMTRATDQYSLAVIAYRMVSGSLPFEGQNNPEIRRRNQSRPPLPVHDEAGRNNIEGVPAALSPVLNKALSPDPEERYESVGQFVTAFRHALGGGVGDRLPRVFISYRRETGSAWAQLFSRELREKHGISPYFDAQGVDNAARFPERLEAAIAETDVFACILGPGTFESAWVREEVRIAHKLRKPMVPVFQETFERPPDEESLPEHLQTLLSFDGVHLLDRRNIHIDHTIEDLARIVANTVRGA